MSTQIPPTPSHNDPPVILIVEDNDQVRLSLRDWLSPIFNSYQFLLAASAEEALELLKSHSPVLIIMDISLPQMNGLEATRQIKHLLPEVMVVVLTIHEEPYYQQQAAAAGASAFIPKAGMHNSLLPLLNLLLSTVKLPKGD